MSFDQLNLHLSNIAINLGHEMPIRRHNEVHSATSCPEISQREYLKYGQSEYKHIKTPTRNAFEKTLFGKTIYPRITVRKENYLRKSQLSLQSWRTA